jgi:hypothetical protein
MIAPQAAPRLPRVAQRLGSITESRGMAGANRGEGVIYRMSEELILTEEDRETFVPRNHDWLLLQLVNWAKLGIETGVTLCVGGQLVAGTLCSQKQYLEAMRAAFANNIKGSAAVAGALDEAFEAMLGSTAETDSLPQPNPKYLHLKDARVFGGATAMPTGAGVWWRGRIAAVDGFHLGALKSA